MWREAAAGCNGFDVWPSRSKARDQHVERIRNRIAFVLQRRDRALEFMPVDSRREMSRHDEFEPCDRVTWEVRAPGFHALHSYRFAALDERRCRFGSWEVAEGPAYRGLRRFWNAHFRYVCRESLAGASALAQP